MTLPGTKQLENGMRKKPGKKNRLKREPILICHKHKHIDKLFLCYKIAGN